MATKLNNKTLSIVFIILIAAFFLVRYFNSNKTKGNFNPNIISLDSGIVDEILLYPVVAKGEEIRIFKENTDWYVQKSESKAKAMESAVMSLINSVRNIKPSRLAATSDEKWEQFHVNDSLGTKVILKLKEGDELGLMIGKFSYSQPNAQNAMQQQQQRVKTTSYFRLINQDEVYATDGFLTMTFNRDFNSFRDQTFIKLNKENVKSLSFKMPGDSSYMINRIDSTWKINGFQANETAVNSLLSKMAMNNQNQFRDSFQPPSSPDYALEISGDNMENISVNIYQIDSVTYIANSSLNSEANFEIPSSSVMDFFKPAGSYMDSITN